MLVIAFSYLFAQYRHNYLAKWTIAWVVYFLRQIFLDKDFFSQSLSLVLTILYIALSIVYSLLMIEGTMDFVGKLRTDYRVLPITAGLCLIASSSGVFFGLPLQYYIVPALIFMGAAHIVAGFIFWKLKVGGIGNIVTSIAFTLVGIHLLDMPFLWPFPSIVPLCILLDGIFKYCIAFGIVFVFFEKLQGNLAEQKEYYRLLADNATDVIYRYRPDHKPELDYISPAVKKLTGLEASELRTLGNVRRIIHPDDRKIFEQLIKSPIQDGNSLIIRVIKSNGDIVWA